MKWPDDYLGKIFNCDCMEIMKQLPDKCVDLCLCDPPYGINKDGQKETTGGHGGRKAYEFMGWDSQRPGKEVFDQILRIGKNAIIWGGNYFADYLPAKMKWMVWDKGQRINQSDGELAWTSYDKALRIFTLNRVALMTDGAQHPTQKPEALMRWCIDEAMGTGNGEQRIIFDPFMGSGTTAKMAIKNNRNWIGSEISEEYCSIIEQRIQNAEPLLFSYCQ